MTHSTMPKRGKGRRGERMEQLTTQIALLASYIKSIMTIMIAMNVALWLILFCKDCHGPSHSGIEREIANLKEMIRTKKMN
jgi:hypothetical protein